MAPTPISRHKHKGIGKKTGMPVCGHQCLKQGESEKPHLLSTANGDRVRFVFLRPAPRFNTRHPTQC